MGPKENYDNNLEINVTDNVFKGCVYLDEKGTWERLVSSKDNSLLCMPIFLEGSRASYTYMSCDGLVLEPTGLRKGDYVHIGLLGASCRAPIMANFLAYTEVYNEGRKETVTVYRISSIEISMTPSLPFFEKLPSHRLSII
jgi:hypothetical protein